MVCAHKWTATLHEGARSESITMCVEGREQVIEFYNLM